MTGPDAHPSQSTATDGGELGLRVVQRVAKRKGIEPADLDRPLHDAVDPDALNRLFRLTGAPGSVTFQYCGHDVTVDSTGDVELD